jgi:hypothetical protein
VSHSRPLFSLLPVLNLTMGTTELPFKTNRPIELAPPTGKPIINDNELPRQIE